MLVEIKCPECGSDSIQSRTWTEHGKEWVGLACPAGHKIDLNEIGRQILDKAREGREKSGE